MKDKKKVKKVKAKVKVKVKAKPATNGSASAITPAPKDGPCFNLRVRTRTQILGYKKAADKAELSINTWAMHRLDQAAASEVK